MSKKNRKEVTAEAVVNEAETKVQVSEDIMTEMNELPTTSSKIRFLDSKGIARKEIARILNKRYQHVRNVLITPIKKEKR